MKKKKKVIILVLALTVMIVSMIFVYKYYFTDNENVIDTESTTFSLIPLEDGEMKTFFGSGELGNEQGRSLETRFALPNGLCFDNAGNLIVFDTFNSGVKRIGNRGAQTILGVNVITDEFSFAAPAYLDGPSADVYFGRPTDGVYSTYGDLFITDSINHAVRILRDGHVYTFAGGTQGSTDGRFGAAKFNHPTAIAIDKESNLYITDTMNHTIRKIDRDGYVTTIAGSAGISGTADGNGSSARFNSPSGIAVDNNGIIYVADTGNHLIRRIENGNVTTIAGVTGSIPSGEDYAPGGFINGPADTAQFAFPQGLCFAKGMLFIADTGNHVIRAITASGNVITITGNGNPGDVDGFQKESMMNKPTGIVFRGGRLYITDSLNNKIKVVLIDTSSEDFAGFLSASVNETIQSRSFVVEDVEGSNASLTKGTLKEYTVRSGTRLAAGNTITSGKNTKITIRLDDDSTITMAASTKIDVSKLNRRELMITVITGAIAVNAAEQPADASTTFKAGNVAMGIRGTMFTLSNSTKQWQVSMLEGSLGISAPSDDYILEAGHILQLQGVTAVVEDGAVNIVPLKVRQIPDSFTLVFIKEHEEILIDTGVITTADAELLDELITEAIANEVMQAQAIQNAINQLPHSVIYMSASNVRSTNTGPGPGIDEDGADIDDSETDPTDPNDPNDPIESTDPNDPTEPTEQTNPTNPTNPTFPTNPNEPTGPNTPTDPGPFFPVDPDPDEPEEEWELGDPQYIDPDEPEDIVTAPGFEDPPPDP